MTKEFIITADQHAELMTEIKKLDYQQIYKLDHDEVDICTNGRIFYNIYHILHTINGQPAKGAKIDTC